MHKKIVFSLVVLLCFLQQSSVVALLVTTNEKSKEQESFPLALLPQDMQNVIISYMEAVGDSKDEFQRIILEYDKTKPTSLKLITGNLFDYIKQETSQDECIKYGFHGNKIPINFYTLKDNSPSIIEVGCIIARAQKSILNGTWYYSFYDPSTSIRIFLDSPSGIYQTVITYDKHKKKPTILGCSLSVHDDLAIAWLDNNDHFFNITFSNLTEVKKRKPIDLDKDKNTLDFSHLNLYLNTMLFNRQGTLLACVHHVPQSRQQTMGQVFGCMSISNKEPLTLAQLCKRMILPIAGAQDLVREKKASEKKEDKKTSWLDFSFW